MDKGKHFGPETRTIAHGPEHSAPTRAMPAQAAPATYSPAQARGNANLEATRTQMITTAGGDARNESSLLAKSQAPPEINITQHSLHPDAAPDPRLILVANPDSQRAARFRILRHHLMDHGRPQIIVVSSPSRGEGKTTCAVNLACALAECGRARVLLVEATVRRPQLAGMFRFVPPWCFAEQLSAHRHQPLLPWGVVEMPDLWLHVAAINPRVSQRQLLDAPAFAIAMERLRIAN